MMGRRGGVVPHAVPPFPPSFVTILPSPAESVLIMVKGKRGAKFTIAELERLLDVIDEILPIGAPDWEKVWDRHVSNFPKKERTVESLKRKFQELARKKIPTGDPECPPHIRNAKRIFRKIVLASDGSTGGSDGSENENDDDGEEDTMDDDEEDEEEEDEEVGDAANSSFDLSIDDAQEPEVEPGAVAAAAGGDRSLSSSTLSSSQGNKRKEGGGGTKQTKKSRAFKKPLKNPRKTARESEDSDDDDSFRSMLNYMMFQNRVEAEQRERQAKTDKEDREREYQLRREELAMQREDNRAQRNMMNFMMMAMLGGQQGRQGQGTPLPNVPLGNDGNDAPGNNAPENF